MTPHHSKIPTADAGPLPREGLAKRSLWNCLYSKQQHPHSLVKGWIFSKSCRGGSEMRELQQTARHGRLGRVCGVQHIFSDSVEAAVHARLQGKRVRLISFPREIFDVRPEEAKQLVAEEVAREQQRSSDEHVPRRAISISTHRGEPVHQLNERGPFLIQDFRLRLRLPCQTHPRQSNRMAIDSLKRLLSPFHKFAMW